MADQDKQLVEAMKWAKHTASARGIRDMIELAKPDLAITPDAFDRDPWLLNCFNGTLELRSGRLREHRREDYITKLCPTPHQPEAKCPTWLTFLDSIFGGDTDLADYVQRLCGYWLTGDVREQILPIAYGTGSNGKTTFINAFAEMVGGDYCITADKSIIIAKKSEGSSTERMDLFGRRLALVIETDEGQKLAEAFVKQLTGGDRIRGRRVFENTWEYAPTHKVLLVTNHKPRVRAIDHAFWRRVKLINFGVTIEDENQDKRLPDKLRAEAPGILAWAVRGCMDWQRRGLGESDSVRRETAKYRADEDVIAQFVAGCCVVADGVKVQLKKLRERYAAWSEEHGEREASGRRFGEYLKAKGFGTHVSNGTRYLGIGLREGDC
jgi:putative DNA primase/helicase